MNIARTLDDEFKRVAKQEGLMMEELVEQVAEMTGYTQRQLYNFRSGKWPLPAVIIPLLCQRFGSRVLMQALAAECERTPINVPDTYELARITTQAVRDDMRHFQFILDAFEDGRIDQEELSQLRASSERVCERIWMFYEIAAADYDRRRAKITQ